MYIAIVFYHMSHKWIQLLVLWNVRCVHFFVELIKKELLFEESSYSDPNFMIHLSKSISRSCCRCVRIGLSQDVV